MSLRFFFLIFALTTNGDSSFRGNRRPGILAAPTVLPTGENALLTHRLGNLKPDELLDALSEAPESQN